MINAAAAGIEKPSDAPAFTITCGMPWRKKEAPGLRLTAVRKARGLTGIELAQTAGTTQRSISCCENDDGVPPSSAVIALAKALKVSADELLGLRPPRVERAVTRLFNSLVTLGAARRNGSMGERSGR